MPDYETESQEHFEIKRGIIVKHELFGRGRVVEVNGKGKPKKQLYSLTTMRKNLIVNMQNSVLPDLHENIFRFVGLIILQGC